MGLSAAVLAGCNSPAKLAAASGPALPGQWSHAAAGQPAAPDLSQWWLALGDASLTRLIQAAQANNTDLKLAQARLRQARGRSQAAQADRYPSVSASLQGSRSKSSVTAPGVDTQRTLWDAGLDASWEADLFGSLSHAQAAARAAEQADEAQVYAAQVTLAAEVALNYVQLRGLQKRLAIARSNLASQTETWQLINWRVQAGMASSLEAEQARANLEQTRAQIPSLLTSANQATTRLAVLLGRSLDQVRPLLGPSDTIDADSNAALALPSVPAQISVGIPASVLKQRPDLLAAERRVWAETARLRQAEAARYPSLRISASVGLQALHLDDLVQGDSAARSIVAALTAPLWDAGRIRSQIDVQDAALEQARLSYEASVWAALGEVENALSALAQSGARLTALDQATQAARAAALMARQRYQSGLIDFQTVLSTERTQLQADDSLAQAQAEQVTALVQLYKALGGGWALAPIEAAPISMTPSAAHP